MQLSSYHQALDLEPAQKRNFILASDGYKFTHFAQYPPGTRHVYSYLEARGGRYEETLFFGLQYYLMEYLAGVAVTAEMIDEAEAFCAGYFGRPGLFDRAMWEHIVEDLGGRLPLEIRAVAEGTVLPVRNALLTITNTDPRCAALTNFAETLLMKVWYPIAVATQSWNIRRTIGGYLEKTGGSQAGLDFMLHDFGYRGVSSEESAGIGAMAHLVNFFGTDTVAGILFAQRYYGATGMIGASVPAAEHSTITSWGREHEADAYRNLLEVYPTGIVSVVSDSYDIYHAVGELWGGRLKDRVLARDGVLVVRPDSGVPEVVVPRVVRMLDDKFGSTTNAAGYRVLNPKVRVIQGDGINQESIIRILEALAAAGYAAENLVFGMGGALLQQLDRDTQKMALKATEVTIGEERREVWKDPVTDPGKASKRGRLSLIHAADGGVVTIRTDNLGKREDLLVPVFRDGVILRKHTFQEIRERARQGL